MLVKRLLGGYPSLSLHDPETYIAMVTSLLCQHAYWVGERAIDQASNVSQFIPPTKGQLVEALDTFRPQVSWTDTYDARSREQLAARLALAPPEDEPRQTFEEIKAEMIERGFNWGGMRDRKPIETAATVRAKFGLSQAQWDAIPDAPAKSTWTQAASEPAA